MQNLIIFRVILFAKIIISIDNGLDIFLSISYGNKGAFVGRTTSLWLFFD
jgi:hypothetical protein